MRCRPGGAPDERSTAQPPSDFYVYILPPFAERWWHKDAHFKLEPEWSAVILLPNPWSEGAAAAHAPS